MSTRAAASSTIGVLTAALRNRSIRQIEAAWAIGVAADWAYLVIMLIVAYDLGGTLAVGILGAVRILPAIAAAPFAAMLVERVGGERVLTLINAARCAGALLTAGAIGADMPLPVLFVLAAGVAGVGALVRPIQYALLPAFARTPSELVAANVGSSLGEGVGTFAGPVAATAVIAWTGSAPGSLLVAAAFAGAAAIVTGIHFERAEDARPGLREGGERVRLSEAPRLLRRYPTTALVILDFCGQVFVRGVLVTLLVVASIELLDMGDAGVGLLNGTLGLGGLLGAVGALGLAGGRRLPGVFVLALALWGLPLLAIAAWPVAALALAAMLVTGVSNAVLDIAGFTLVQRGVRTEDRVAFFGVMEGLFGAGLLVGSLAAPALVELVGVRGALVAAGALLPVLALATWRPLERGTMRRDDLEQRLALLRLDPLFAPLPLTALDLLAERMTPASFASGEALIRKGERGDEYLVLAGGEAEVSDEGRGLGTVGRGEGVGEIALLYDVPRTATVVARTPVDAYRIDSETFLEAMRGPTASAIAERIAATRLERSGFL